MGERVRAPPEHAGDHARGDPEGGLRGRGRRRAASALRDGLVGDPGASAVAGRVRARRSRRLRRLPPLPALRDRCVDAHRRAARTPRSPSIGADPDLAERDDILSLLLDGAVRGRLADERPRAARPADDPAARRPRDDRDRARLGVRPAAAPPRRARAARGRARPLGEHDYLDAVDPRDAAGAPGGPVHRPPAAPGRRARRLRAPRRHRGPGGHLPRPHPPRRLSRPAFASAPSDSSATPPPRPTPGSRSAAAPGAASAPPSPSSRCGS